MFGNYHLGDTLATVDDKRFIACIKENNAYFATVIGINRSRCVKDCYTLFESQSAAWANLCFVTNWKLNVQTSRDEYTFHWSENDGILIVCSQIHSSGLDGLVGWQLIG